MCKLTLVHTVRAREGKKQTHQVHFPVRYEHEHSREQERDKSHDICNDERCVSPTRIHTRSSPAGGKYGQQRTRAGKGPERNVYAVAPASHIIASEYHVANACVIQNQTHIQRDDMRHPNKLVAGVPNKTLILGRNHPH